MNFPATVLGQESSLVSKVNASHVAFVSFPVFFLYLFCLFLNVILI